MPLLSRYLPPLLRPAPRKIDRRNSDKFALMNDVPGWPGDTPIGMRAEILATCANPRCNSGWLHIWRRREAPIFEGGWCCSEECMAARIGAALRREMDGRGRTPETYHHRIPLGLVMFEQGWITKRELQTALAAQKASGGGRLGAWLVRQRCVNEEMVTRALGLQWGCAVLGAEVQSCQGLASLVPRLLIDAFGALPLRIAAGRILYLGFEDHLDPALALAVERIAGLTVECGFVPESQFRPAHGHMLEARFPSTELIEAATEPALAAAFTRTIERTRPVETRLARVHDFIWLRMWLRKQSGPLPEIGFVRDVIGAVGTH